MPARQGVVVRVGGVILLLHLALDDRAILQLDREAAENGLRIEGEAVGNFDRLLALGGVDEALLEGDLCSICRGVGKWRFGA